MGPGQAGAGDRAFILMDWTKIFFWRQARPLKPALPRKQSGQAKKILLADDSVTIHKVVRLTLEDGDYEVETVDNGDDAVRRAKELRPDIILADALMPGKNGYEVCAAIKADPGLRQVPVVILAGNFEGYDERKGAQCGAAGHIVKPFESSDFLNKVEEILARAAAPPARKEQGP